MTGNDATWYLEPAAIRDNIMWISGHYQDVISRYRSKERFGRFVYFQSFKLNKVITTMVIRPLDDPT